MPPSSTSATATEDYHPFATFALLLAVASMVDLLSFPFWLWNWQGWCFNVATIAVVLKPRCVLRFTCFEITYLLKLWTELPYLPNHLFLLGLIHVSVLLGLLWILCRDRAFRASAGDAFREFSRRFWIFFVLLALKLLHLTFTADIIILGSITTIATATGLAWGLIGRKAVRANGLGDRLFHHFAPPARIAFVIVYLWAAVQKMNWDYLNPGISCATFLHRDIGECLPWITLPTADWALHFVIWSSIGLELAIPVLLLIPRTRFAGVMVAILFKLWISISSVAGVYAFCGLIVAVLYLYLPRNAAVEMERFWRRIRDRLKGGYTKRGDKLSRWALSWIYLTAILIQLSLYAARGTGREIYDDAHRIGWIFFLGWGAWMSISYAAAFLRSKGKPLAWPNRPRFSPAWLMVPLVLFNGANPWIGLKTETSFAMFSNLRTEPDYRWERGNHVFLKRIDLFDYQIGLVEIVEAEPDILSPSGPPRTVRHSASPGSIIPRFELRRSLAEQKGNVRVLYRRDGELRVAVRENGIASPPELFEPVPWYLDKYLWFRRHVSLEKPMQCTH